MRKTAIALALFTAPLISITGQCNVISGESGTINNSDSSVSVEYITEISGGSQFYLNPHLLHVTLLIHLSILHLPVIRPRQAL